MDTVKEIDELGRIVALKSVGRLPGRVA
jgi:hypothetical protein